MTKAKNRRLTRLGRIENKCDRILSELIIIRHQISCRPEMDNAIDRLHRAARKMRAQCELERDTVRRLFHSSRKG